MVVLDGGFRDRVGRNISLPLKPGTLGSPKLHPHLFPDSLYSLSFLQDRKQRMALRPKWLLLPFLG